MPLTDAQIRAAKPTEKVQKLADGGGLYLRVDPKGGRAWRLKYRFGGREQLLSMGKYPDVSLAKARAARDAARRDLAAGINPSTRRKAEKYAQAQSFKAVADEWLLTQDGVVEADTLQRTRDRLAFVSRYIGTRPVGELGAPDFLVPLKAVEHRGKLDTAHRMRAEIGRVMLYAVRTGRAARNAASDLQGALKPKRTKHFAALTNPAEVGALLLAIDGYTGFPSTEFALQIAPYVFVRPGELRSAQWSEFDLESAKPTWRIPASRMKAGREHWVPLARQVVNLLMELKPYTGAGRLLFPCSRVTARPISDNTLNAALRRMGYTTEQATAHGFRSTASTLLRDEGFDNDVIELQLAHSQQDKTRGAYDRAQRLEDRRAMMQSYADLLDRLRNEAHVRAKATKGDASAEVPASPVAVEASSTEAHL